MFRLKWIVGNSDRVGNYHMNDEIQCLVYFGSWKIDLNVNIDSVSNQLSSTSTVCQISLNSL